MPYRKLTGDGNIEFLQCTCIDQSHPVPHTIVYSSESSHMHTGHNPPTPYILIYSVLFRNMVKGRIGVDGPHHCVCMYICITTRELHSDMQCPHDSVCICHILYIYMYMYFNKRELRYIAR